MKIKNSSKFFNNNECPYFPCHNTENIENVNCIFCYCPLYNLTDCGGKFKVLENGIKDCSDCMLPHKKENYDYIINKLK